MLFCKGASINIFSFQDTSRRGHFEDIFGSLIVVLPLLRDTGHRKQYRAILHLPYGTASPHPCYDWMLRYLLAFHSFFIVKQLKTFHV